MATRSRYPGSLYGPDKRTTGCLHQSDIPWTIRRLLVYERACFAAGNLLECQSAYPSQEVERALDSTATPVEHMGVDHGRLHTLMPEQFLDRPDVVSVHEHVRRE
jgi:hypothetical protein